MAWQGMTEQLQAQARAFDELRHALEEHWNELKVLAKSLAARQKQEKFQARLEERLDEVAGQLGQLVQTPCGASLFQRPAVAPLLAPSDTPLSPTPTSPTSPASQAWPDAPPEAPASPKSAWRGGLQSERPAGGAAEGRPDVQPEAPGVVAADCREESSGSDGADQHASVSRGRRAQRKAKAGEAAGAAGHAKAAKAAKPGKDRTCEAGGPVEAAKPGKDEKGEKGGQEEAADRYNSKSKESSKSGRRGYFHSWTLSEISRERDGRESWIQRMVHSKYFQLFSNLLIGSNTIFIMVQTQHAAEHLEEDVPPLPIQLLDSIFCVLFVSELCLRIAAERTRFCRGRDKYWNAFDTILVVLQVQDQVATFAILAQSFSDQRAAASAESGGGFDISFLRTVRLLRVLRVVRLFKRFAKLTVMLNEIIGSMSALFWLFMLLGVFLVILGLVFMIASIDVLKDQEQEESLRDDLLQVIPEALRRVLKGPEAVVGLRDDLQQWFGTLPSALLSLFKAMTGGMEWEKLGDRLMEVSFLYGLLFIGFQGFALFGVVNVATAVFVESARTSARRGELELEQHKLSEMHEALSNIPVSQTGAISQAVFADFTKNEKVQEFLSSIEMSTAEARHVFDLLDVDGGVHAHVVTRTFMRMLGNPRSTDLVVLHLEHVRLASQLLDFCRLADVRLASLCRATGAGGRHQSSSAGSVSPQALADKRPRRRSV